MVCGVCEGGLGAGVGGFLEEEGGGGGGLDAPGGGGGALGGGISGADLVEVIDMDDDGLCDGFGGGLRRFATSGLTGGAGGPSVEGGRTGPGLEDGTVGGLGACELS